MKRYVFEGRVIAEFRLEGDRVQITWIDRLAEQLIILDSLLTEDASRELTPADGKEFYDRLEHAYPGSIELA